MVRQIYRICVALGIWDVDNWLDVVSWSQLQKWLEFYKLEPFGDLRSDLRAGIITSNLVNIQLDPKHSKPTKPTDFMPFIDSDKPKPKPLTSKEQWESVKRMAKIIAKARS